MKFRYLLFAFLLTACGRHMPAEEAAFYNIQVNPLLDDSKQFVGSGQHVTLIFQSDGDDRDLANIDSFPDPPVIILNKKTGLSCTIEDGGIWERSEVYLSADERYVLMYEFSGSSGDLASYDTQTCRQIKRLDISGTRRLEVNGSKALLNRNCNPDVDGANMEGCLEFETLDLNLFIENRMESEK